MTHHRAETKLAMALVIGNASTCLVGIVIGNSEANDNGSWVSLKQLELTGFHATQMNISYAEHIDLGAA